MDKLEFLLVLLVGLIVTLIAHTTMEFEAYLTQKKIDSAAFQANEPEKYQEWKELFELINPESFTAQKKFLMNPIRRRYLLLS